MGSHNRITPISDPIIRAGLLVALAYWLVQALFDTYLLHLGSFTSQLVPTELPPLMQRLFVTVILLLLTAVAYRLANRPRPLISGGNRDELSEVTFLSRTATDFIDLPLEEDIYQYIGDRIKELVGDGVVVVNAFDEEADALRVRTILGAGALLETTVRALGQHPVGLSFKLTEHARQGITQGILEKAEGGLYEACFGKINEDLCHRLEYMAGVDEVYGIGLARKGGIFGDALIITRKGNPALNRGVIEAFVNQASVALHRRKAEEDLLGLSLVDDLTGLYNRRGFLTLAEQQLKIANRMQRHMMLLFVDMDNLKRVNDNCGHQEGDRAIREIGQIMKRSFRESDIVARMGGDEFVVLVVEPGEASEDLFIARLMTQIETRNAAGDMRYPLAMSIGVELYDPFRPCSINELLQRADQLMYAQKRTKKSRTPARV